MKYLSLFSGIGAFEKALDRLKKQYELVGYCEIDKYASKSYSAIHNVPETLNLGDITKVDEKALPKDIDLITYGFPCQDISIAGKQKGLFNEDGTRTRSGLFFEALRIIEETQPKVAIAENVKNLTGKTFKKQFEIVLNSLDAAGYNNYWQVLNAKDFGIPQNRERVFIVSIRKDIDTKAFCFPPGFPLKLCLKDLMEVSVAERFFVNTDPAADLIQKVKNGEIEMGVFRSDSIIKIGEISSSQDGVVVSENGIAPTHTAGHGNTPKVLISISNLPCTTREKQIAGALVASIYKQGGRNLIANIESNLGYEGVIDNEFRLRKYTPLECFRLMGFDDADHAQAEAVNSNTQLYKQAGNSIVVSVPQAIFEKLFEANIL